MNLNVTVRSFFALATMAALVVSSCAHKGGNNLVTYKQSGAIASGLSNVLTGFGCQISFEGTSLAGAQGRWVVQRDADGATVWIEGDYTAPLLDAFQKKFGQPASLKSPSPNGFAYFSYRKDQSGAGVDCMIETRSGWGLKAPLTQVGVFTRIAGP